MDGRIGHRELVGLQAVLLDLLRQQVAARDVALLILGVSGDADDLHAIEERRRDVQAVRRAHEHHLGEIEVHLEIVIVEGAVLLRIEHLEQRRGRIAAEVRRHLVDLVEQEQRISHAALGEVLDDLARHRADVGAPVAADLGLVAHTAQRHADELAVGRAGDALPERGLADARRSDEAQDRAAQILHALLHGEILDDALLDLLEAEVVGLEHFLGRRDVEMHFAALLPRGLHQPIDEIAHHGRFRGHRRHELQLGELGVGLLARLFRHARRLDALLELADLVRRLVELAELLLNGLHLLVQVVLALALLHLLLDAAANALLDLQDVHLALDHREHVLEALAHVRESRELFASRRASATCAPQPYPPTGRPARSPRAR